MKLVLFFKLAVFFLCASLLAFALLPDVTLLTLLKLIAGGVALAIAVSALYPEVRGVKNGDVVAIISTGVPIFLSRFGRAMQEGKKNRQIKVRLDNGGEVVGIIESYEGLLSPPKIRVIYEEKILE